MRSSLSSLRTQYRMYRYTQEEQRLLAGIRYTMTQSEFSSYNPYTFATDISDALLAAVKEKQQPSAGRRWCYRPGAHLPDRQSGFPCAGVTGSISSEEYNKLKEAEKTYSLSNPSGYRIGDTLGKSGIERVMEDELRGQNGLRTVVQDQEGQCHPGGRNGGSRARTHRAAYPGAKCCGRRPKRLWPIVSAT